MKKVIFFLFFSIYLYSEESIVSLLENMQKAQGKINTMQANFFQKKKSSLFENPQELSGVVYFKKPDFIRWEYLKPENYIIFVEKEKFQIYYPSLKKVKVGKIARLRGKIFSILLAQEPLVKLKNHFMIELRKREKEDVLILTPLTFKLKKYWKSWTLIIDRSSFLPKSIEILEKDGDLTFIEFKDVKIDITLEEEIFKLKIPSDVVVENYIKNIQ